MVFFFRLYILFETDNLRHLLYSNSCLTMFTSLFLVCLALKPDKQQFEIGAINLKTLLNFKIFSTFAFIIIDVTKRFCNNRMKKILLLHVLI